MLARTGELEQEHLDDIRKQENEAETMKAEMLQLEEENQTTASISSSTVSSADPFKSRGRSLRNLAWKILRFSKRNSVPLLAFIIVILLRPDIWERIKSFLARLLFRSVY